MMQHLQPNTTLQGGKYRIERVLGQGGFGNTYVGVNTVFNERVAIKEFFMRGVTLREGDHVTVSVSVPDNRESFREQKEKFKKEALRIRLLKNEHIIGVQDFFEENGTAYYVMDYVDGENLAERLKKTGRAMTESEVRLIIPQILDALKAVHAEKMWHLDLKPANIMLEKGGKVKLIDFGASKQLNAQKGGATTSTAISYTNGYAPREQMEQNYDKFGPWTDIYALGATLYNLLTNKRPPLPSDIDDDDSEDKHQSLPFPDGVSEGMKSLVLKLMKTNRKFRPQGVDEILPLLESKPVKEENSTKDTIVSKVEEPEDSEATIIATPKSEETIIEEKPKPEVKPEQKVYSPEVETNSSTTDNGNSTMWKILGTIAVGIIAIILINNGGIGCNNTAVEVAAPVDSIEAPASIDTKYEIVENKEILNDGSSYDGEYLNGLADGFGTYIWADGQKFVGEWEKGHRIYGTYTWPQVRSGYIYKYVGQFGENGEFEGEGIAYYKDSENDKGFWKNGKFLGRNKGKRTYFNTRESAETLVTGDFKWNLISVTIEDNKTILKKKVMLEESHPNGGYYINSSKDEFIEDAITGDRYYLISSELEISPGLTPIIKARYFNEVYPTLPSSVKSINISSGTYYYIQNLNIK